MIDFGRDITAPAVVGQAFMSRERRKSKTHEREED
jgi:hypothetical protein